MTTLRQILSVTWKDLKLFITDPGALAIMFVQPLVFIVVMSFALAGVFSPDDQPVRLLAVNLDRGEQAKQIIRQLDALDAFIIETDWDGASLSIERAEALIVQKAVQVALVFPPAFSEALAQSPAADQRITATVRLIADPTTPATVIEPLLGTLRGLIERAAFNALAPQGVDLLIGQINPALPEAQRQALKSQVNEALRDGVLGERAAVQISKETPAAMRIERYPNVYQQNVPGYTLYGIFWIVSLMVSSVLQEKREGTFRRLRAAPIHPAVLMAGKLLPYYVINLAQVALMLGISSALFGLSLGNSPAGLILVSVAATATSTGLGVLMSALVKTEAQAGGLVTLVLLTGAALGGCFVGRFLMPDWLQTVGLITPHAWALDAYQDLLVRGYGVAEIAPKVAVLFAFALAFFGVGIWRFRWE